MAFEFAVHRNRDHDFTGTIYEADETTEVVLAASDVLRLKVFRRDAATPVLDIDSVAALAGGSVLAFTAATGDYTLKINKADTSGLVVGVYEAELSVVDDSDSDRIKVAEYGTIGILGAGAGDIGLL
jgi:hypothetical protein